MRIERRQTARRAAVVQAVVDQVLKSRQGWITLDWLREFLNIPHDGARRIIRSLVSAGLLKEVSHGVWRRIPQLP
jgi:ribosomal protein S25